MLTPTPPTATTSTDTASFEAAITGLTNELRAVYAQRFTLALQDAETTRDRFETPDGTGPIDPVYAADTTAARFVTDHLTTAFRRWLPDARCLERTDEPAVIDSHWLHHHQVLVVEWDYTYDFGDPAGLTIWEATR